jgi:hypothetical protein
MTEQRFIILGAGLAALALFVLVKKNGAAADVGAALGEAAANAATGAVAGAAMGIGDAIGIPRTNETECEKAMREGRYWDASFACPAGDFLGGVGSDIGGAIFDWTH